MKFELDLTAVAKVVATLALATVAAFVGYGLWSHYRDDPWTRDGRVRADVVQVAPDVSGLVTRVLVHDNENVNVGDVLFVLDRPRYQLALQQAAAAATLVQAQISQARREDKRNRDLKDLVSGEIVEQTKSKLDQLDAMLLQAKAALETARLNLERTEVRAAANGWVTNLDLRPGSYVSVGKPVLALVDRDSLYVVGYFEETKIPRIVIGDEVQVRLMGDSHLLTGHVDSIAGGIEDRERSAASGLLANVNPTFNWVRLAQRVPVRIRLGKVPEGIRLIMGQTATVSVVGKGSDRAVVGQSP